MVKWYISLSAKGVLIMTLPTSSEERGVIVGSQDLSKKNLQVLRYMEAYKLLKGKRFCTVTWVILSVQGPRKNHQCKSLSFFLQVSTLGGVGSCVKAVLIMVIVMKQDCWIMLGHCLMTEEKNWTEEVGNCPAFHFLVQQQTNASWWSLHCSTFAAHQIIILGCLWPQTIPRAPRVFVCSTSLDARGLLACFHCCGRGVGVLSWGELQQLEQTLLSGRQLLQLPWLSSRNLSTLEKI